MLNYIWAAIVLGGILIAGLLGNLSGENGVIPAALDMAKTAVMGIALPLSGMMMFWLGTMRLMEKAGLLAAVSHLLHPLMRRLFPEVPAGHPALSAMIMNFAANMLGLGNSATPLGLKAMDHLQQLNPHKQTASNAMVTFLALNTAAFTLVPMTAINYLAAAGIKNAYEVIFPTILATACTTVTAIVMAKSLQRLSRFRVEPDTVDPSESSSSSSSSPDSSSRFSPRGKLFLTLLLTAFAGVAVLELAAPTLRQSVLEKTGIANVVKAAEQRSADAKAQAAAAKPVATETTATATPTGFRASLNSASALAIPFLLVLTLGVALARRVKVYEEFVDGAKEGFAVATRIMPFLVAMFAALAIFRYSGALLLLEYMLAPLLGAVGFPVDLLPMALMRPLSGSGSLGVLTEILARPDASEFLKMTAAIMFGSTETTFYVVAVYFGSVGVKKIRHALIAGLTADFVGLTMSVVIGRLMFPS
ncbi:MAG: nucleoside recognition domain-containing protein [Verrucomicrobiaceae bacterium]|nr:nucleoside recognition domain-containing protein [Verrucomicrobiaceae bacterium]